MRYILASQSPRRQELLSVIVPQFEIMPADIDETLATDMPLPQAVAQLAADKAQAIFQQNPDAVIIGSDTVVVVDGEVLGKPADQNDAMRMLTLLSGREHEVMTGYAITDPVQRSIYQNTTVTKVRFATLSQVEIQAYIATGEPMDKAGAYGIQGLGAKLVEGIAGDYYSVMGLPVQAIYAQLQKMKLL